MKHIEAFLSAAAMIVSIAAAAFSWWQVEVSKKHNELSVSPLLQIATHAEGPKGRNGIYISNVGLGPAIITGFSVSTNGFTASGFSADMWREALKAASITPECFSTEWPVERQAMKAGDEMGLITVTKADGAEHCYRELVKLMAGKGIDTTINYQSIYQISSVTQSTSKRNSATVDLLLRKIQ